MSIVEFARHFLHVREAANNSGLRVNAIQIWSGGQNHDSWCMELAWLWLDCHLGGADRPDNAAGVAILRVQNVQEFREFCQEQGWEVDVPAPGDFCISVRDNHGHHIGLVTIGAPLTTIAGNTSADGTSANGDRCAEHPVPIADKEFYRVPGVVA